MPKSAKVDEKGQEALREKTLKEGRFAAMEDGDNAIFVEEEKDQFFGTEPERMNHAEDVDAPLEAEYEKDDDPEKLVFEAAREREKEMAERGPVGFQGFTPRSVHPTERKNPADPFINAQRAALSAAGAGASLPGSTDEDKKKAGAKQGGSTEGQSGGGGVEHAAEDLGV